MNNLVSLVSSDKLSQENYILTIGLLNKLINLVSNEKLPQEKYTLVINLLNKIIGLFNNEILDEEGFVLTINAIEKIIDNYANNSIDFDKFVLMIQSISEIIDKLNSRLITISQYKLLINSIDIVIGRVNTIIDSSEQFELLINEVDNSNQISYDVESYQEIIDSMNKYYLNISESIVNSDDNTMAKINNNLTSYKQLVSLYGNDVVDNNTFKDTIDALNDNIKNNDDVIVSNDENKSLVLSNKGWIIGGVLVFGLLIVGLLHGLKKKKLVSEDLEDDNVSNDVDYPYNPGVYPVKEYELNDSLDNIVIYNNESDGEKYE